MVFSSFPLHLDPPHSWNQPPQTHPPAAGDDRPPPPPAASTGPGPTRPGSMAERARLAKIPQPEAALSCPRCDSNNTKFCYFNNYSLAQPRHFCKACRRYWTRGGSLRNVPVGGGCRRNKRGGKSPSLTPATSSKLQPSKSPALTTAETPENLVFMSAAPPLSLLAAAPWNPLQEYGHAPNFLGGMEAAAAGMYGYHEGEWSFGGGINGGGWMGGGGTDHVLGFGGASSTGNGNL